MISASNYSSPYNRSVLASHFILSSSSRSGLGLHDSGQLWFPLVAILDELFLVVKQLLVQEGRVLEVGALDNRIDGACLLAEAAEDALGHVDVVLGRATRTIRPWLTLNLDSEGRASCFTKLASDASLLACGVASEGVLAAEHGAERAFFPRVMQDVIGFERRVDSEEEDWPDQLSVEQLSVHVFRDIGAVKLVWELIAH